MKRTKRVQTETSVRVSARPSAGLNSTDLGLVQTHSAVRGPAAAPRELPAGLSGLGLTSALFGFVISSRVVVIQRGRGFDVAILC